MKKKGNTDAPPKQKERHIVTWSQQVDSLSSALVLNLLEKFSVGFFVLLTWVVLGCRRMTFSASKLASMELKSRASFIWFCACVLVGLNVESNWWEFLVVVFVCSWAIIASKFKDKTTRQCRRRLAQDDSIVFVGCLIILCFLSLIISLRLVSPMMLLQMVHLFEFGFQERRMVSGGRPDLMRGKSWKRALQHSELGSTLRIFKNFLHSSEGICISLLWALVLKTKTFLNWFYVVCLSKVQHRRLFWVSILSGHFVIGWGCELWSNTWCALQAQKIFGNRWTEIAKVVSGRYTNRFLLFPFASV